MVTATAPTMRTVRVRTPKRRQRRIAETAQHLTSAADAEDDSGGRRRHARSVSSGTRFKTTAYDAAAGQRQRHDQSEERATSGDLIGPLLLWCGRSRGPRSSQSEPVCGHGDHRQNSSQHDVGSAPAELSGQHRADGGEDQQLARPPASVRTVRAPTLRRPYQRVSAVNAGGYNTALMAAPASSHDAVNHTTPVIRRPRAWPARPGRSLPSSGRAVRAGRSRDRRRRRAAPRSPGPQRTRPQVVAGQPVSLAIVPESTGKL